MHFRFDPSVCKDAHSGTVHQGELCFSRPWPLLMHTGQVCKPCQVIRNICLANGTQENTQSSFRFSHCTERRHKIPPKKFLSFMFGEGGNSLMDGTLLTCLSVLAATRSRPCRALLPLPPSLPPPASLPLAPLPPSAAAAELEPTRPARCKYFSCCSELIWVPSPRCAMAACASLQCLGLVTLAAILLQIIGVAVSFIYFNKVLNTVRKRVSFPSRTTSRPNECMLTAEVEQETGFNACL